MQRESIASSKELIHANAHLAECQTVLDAAKKSAAELHQLNLPNSTRTVAMGPDQAGGSNMAASPQRNAHHSRGTKRKEPATDNSPGLCTPQRPTSRRRSHVSPHL